MRIHSVRFHSLTLVGSWGLKKITSMIKLELKILMDLRKVVLKIVPEESRPREDE